jgi:hypothetical protein
LDIIASVGNTGLYLSLIVGLLLDAYGIRTVICLGAFLIFIGKFIAFILEGFSCDLQSFRCADV